MPKIVAKFGGSNFKDKKHIQKVVTAIRNYNQPVIVVVSAFYGITNYLAEMLLKIRADEEQINLTTDFLTRMKQDIIYENIPDKKDRRQILQQVMERLNRLERYFFGVHYIGEIPDFLEDIVLSYGERFSSLLLTYFLQYNGLEAVECLPEKMGFYTDGEFGNATVDFAAAEDAVRAKLSGDKIYVVPGFYGISQAGKVTLLGRGGSDYSAAAVARCVQAQSLDIWKDVDGFLSADPQLVKNPQQVAELSYREAAELAYFGAKILHPRTVEPLMSHNIPIRIFNINTCGQSMTPFSVIKAHGKRSQQVVKSVTYSDDFGILKLKGPGVGIKPGILAKVTTALDNHRINIKSVITAQTSINFLFSLNNLERAYEITSQLGLKAVGEILVEEDLTLIAPVGEGILEKHGIAARMFSAVSRKKINIQIISLGASPVAAYFIVHRRDRDAAVREIHKEFFGYE